MRNPLQELQKSFAPDSVPGWGDRRYRPHFRDGYLKQPLQMKYQAVSA